MTSPNESCTVQNPGEEQGCPLDSAGCPDGAEVNLPPNDDDDGMDYVEAGLNHDLYIKVTQNNSTKSYQIRNCEFISRPFITTYRQANSQAIRLIEHFTDGVVCSREDEEKHNRPDVVRKSFMVYLRSQFPYGIDYIHPLTKQTFSNSYIAERIYGLKVALSPMRHRSVRTIEYDYEPQDPQAVRQAFIKYLRTIVSTSTAKSDFKVHASCHGRCRSYTYSEVKQALGEHAVLYNDMCALQARALWALFTSKASAAFIKENFGFVDNNVKRLWYSAIDAVMMILNYRDLLPDSSSRDQYHYLWTLIITPANRSKVAEYFVCSDSTMRRVWNDILDTLLLLLLYPDLTTEHALYIYNSRA